MSFEQEIQSALASLNAGDKAAIADGIADPGGAAKALEGDRAVLKVAPLLGEGAEGYCPTPAEPLWAGLSRGSSEISLSPLRGDGQRTQRVLSLLLEVSQNACCDAPSCSVSKRHESLYLCLKEEGAKVPNRLLCAELHASAGEDGASLHSLQGLAERLRDFLGVELETGEEEGRGELPTPVGETLDAAAIGRFQLRSEGERVVLRDHASVGPKATAGRNTVIGILLMGIAAFLWFQVASSLRAGQNGAALGFGAGAMLFTLAGYAFLGVARFSRLYRANSAPLVAMGNNRLIVAPWVSRTGAVDLRPEGRLGAAIVFGEVSAVDVKARDGGYAVELATDHGPMDAMVVEKEALARYWVKVLSRVIDELRHPATGPSARQRARQKRQNERAAAREAEAAKGVGQGEP